jgi:phytanoyl-CoA hydroxylase
MLKNNPMTNLFKISSPHGKEIEIPVEVDDDFDLYLNLNSSNIRNYYNDNGYVVVRNVISHEFCDEVIKSFVEEVKVFGGYIYRQSSEGNSPEKNRFNKNGYLSNSILNFQDLRNDSFSKFKDNSISVVTSNILTNLISNILEEPGTMVQSMYFEGNPKTGAHQDTYYLDSDPLGNMCAAWIALEDIKPGAGRFYVYPGSHKIDIDKNSGDYNIAYKHKNYSELILETIEKYDLKCIAPSLRKGDVLFWSSKTIHGSLETVQPEFSRSSITAHFIPSSNGFLQFQSRQKRLNIHKVNSVSVHFPKDQNSLKNRFIFYLETRFPSLFKFTKKLAIKIITG